ncbi:MAG: aspartate carbamoyltransferase catalytic subunit, partial [Phycisphaerales bacterium]|nr:aspartate carbamoyltransferase catalytic subunit [Phycisphaerales bacterium]
MPTLADANHLLALEGLDRDTLTGLLDASEAMLPAVMDRAAALDPAPLAGRIIANLFFEDSTRTRTGFTIAAHRLGASTVDLTRGGSSMSKGETLVDTALNIEAMGVDAMIVRTPASGGAAMVAAAVA